MHKNHYSTFASFLSYAPSLNIDLISFLEHNSKTNQWMSLKLNTLIENIKRKCSAQKSLFCLFSFVSYSPLFKIYPISCLKDNSKANQWILFKLKVLIENIKTKGQCTRTITLPCFVF